MARKRKPLRQPLLELADKSFACVTTGDCASKDSFTAWDCLMAALAMFDFKIPSMLKFDQATAPGQPLAGNLAALYGVAKAPSDSTLRRRLDAVDPKCVHRVLRTTFGWLRGRRFLDRYRVAEGRIPFALDASERCDLTMCATYGGGTETGAIHYQVACTGMSYREWRRRSQGVAAFDDQRHEQHAAEQSLSALLKAFQYVPKIRERRERVEGQFELPARTIAGHDGIHLEDTS